MRENLNLKKYNKPTLEFVELRIEERLARCYMEPQQHHDDFTMPLDGNNGHGEGLPGDHPGCVYHCPHS